MPKALLVTNLATHYRRPLYHRLTQMLDIEFVFYSDGGEWYWKAEDSGISGLPARRLKGFWLAGTRITPGLVPVMLRASYDVCIGSLNGKFALPISYVGARVRRKPFVLWAGMWRHPDTRVHRLTRRPTRYLYRNADAILTYGRHVSRFVIAEGANAAKVWEAPQAVDLDRFSTEGRAPSTHESLRIGYVGRLEAWKGAALLIRALAELSLRGVAFTAQLAGEGPLRQELQDLIEELVLSESVRLVGQIPNAELPDFYRNLDVVVVPSIETPGFSEPWSLAVNEAMGCGCLVIASDAVGAAADGLVADGQTGYVFPAGDVGALARVLEAAWRDVPATESLRRAGNTAVQKYSFDASAEAFRDAVSAAVAGQRQRTRSSPWPGSPTPGRDQ